MKNKSLWTEFFFPPGKGTWWFWVSLCVIWEAHPSQGDRGTFQRQESNFGFITSSWVGSASLVPRRKQPFKYSCSVWLLPPEGLVSWCLGVLLWLLSSCCLKHLLRCLLGVSRYLLGILQCFRVSVRGWIMPPLPIPIGVLTPVLRVWLFLEKGPLGKWLW